MSNADRRVLSDEDLRTIYWEAKRCTLENGSGRTSVLHSVAAQGHADGLRAVEAAVLAKQSQLVAYAKELEAAYHELIGAVSNRWPEETRHQTAPRYIREREDSANNAPAKAERKGDTDGE